MDEMERQVIALQASMSGLVSQFAEWRQESRERHAENVKRLEDIFSEQKKTNGRVTAIEVAAKTEKELSSEWPAVKVLVGIALGVAGAVWFVLTVLLGFHK